MTLAGFAVFQMHAGKTAQRQFRLRNSGVDVTEINLRHFIAVAFAGVLHRERHFHRAVGEQSVFESSLPLLKSNLV